MVPPVFAVCLFPQRAARRRAGPDAGSAEAHGQGVHIALRGNDAQQGELAAVGVGAEVVGHVGGDVDPCAGPQVIGLVPHVEEALSFDAHRPVAPGVGVGVGCRAGRQGEAAHHIVVPEAAVGAVDDALFRILDEVAAGDHRQVRDHAAVLHFLFHDVLVSF